MSWEPTVSVLPGGRAGAQKPAEAAGWMMPRGCESVAVRALRGSEPAAGLQIAVRALKELRSGAAEGTVCARAGLEG